jgi:Fe-S-cluster-containing hydrogenase component 2
VAKVLIIEYQKCNGCNDCETACAMHFTGKDDPLQSRIRVIKTEEKGVWIPVTCQHCKDAPCIEACPAKALWRETKLDRVLINQDKCIGCKTCVTVCPFGGISFNKVTQQIMKCDFCDGDPACVKVCEPEALRYADVTELSIMKRSRIADKYFSLYMDKGSGIDPESE